MSELRCVVSKHRPKNYLPRTTIQESISGLVGNWRFVTTSGQPAGIYLFLDGETATRQVFMYMYFIHVIKRSLRSVADKNASPKLTK